MTPRTTIILGSLFLASVAFWTYRGLPMAREYLSRPEPITAECATYKRDIINLTADFQRLSADSERQSLDYEIQIKIVDDLTRRVNGLKWSKTLTTAPTVDGMTLSADDYIGYKGLSPGKLEEIRRALGY